MLLFGLDRGVAMLPGACVLRVAPLLPVTGKVAVPLVEFPGVPTHAEEESKFRADYMLEPDPEAIFNKIVPQYIDVSIFFSMLSSYASEQASRRMAMKAATDAATRMGKDLKMIYNRARQESITKELLDIVGGAEAIG